MDLNELSNKVIGFALDVHSKLGPGLLENVYKECLFHKLRKESFIVEMEKLLSVIYEDIKLDCGYRLDLLVDRRLVVEVKSVNMLKEIHSSQLRTYLRLGNYKLGLLLNFNVKWLKNGIQREVNGLEEET